MVYVKSFALSLLVDAEQQGVQVAERSFFLVFVVSKLADAGATRTSRGFLNFSKAANSFG